MKPSMNNSMNYAPSEQNPLLDQHQEVIEFLKLILDEIQRDLSEDELKPLTEVLEKMDCARVVASRAQDTFEATSAALQNQMTDLRKRADGQTKAIKHLVKVVGELDAKIEQLQRPSDIWS